MRSYSIKTWLMRGTYPRLFLPILGIIVAVTLVRYHLMLDAELQEANAHQQAQLQTIGHYALPLMVRASANGSHTELQAMLDAELGFHPDILSLQWNRYQQTLQADAVNPARSQAPMWFQRVAALKPVSQSFFEPLPDGTEARLVVVVGTAQRLDQVWHTIGTQMRITALNIFTILFLLTLLLRANARMLSRLNLATERFSAGALQTRMEEKGTLEMRAVAQTFNGMAGQIEALIQSLQKTQQEQEEQLHFTRQLINALPLPVFVRDSDGKCLAVNQAWEAFFSTPAQTVVGSPLRSDFLSLPHAHEGRTRQLLNRKDHEVVVKAGAYDVREMVYFKAPFTLLDGSVGGSIGALVDITERKLAQEALLQEKERAVVTLSSIADGVITTDVHGHIDGLNEAAQFLTGYTEAQALGRPLTEVFQLDAASQALPKNLRADQLHRISAPVHAINQLLLHHSGERYAIEFTAAPIRRDRGSTGGCVLVFHDVTETRDLRQRISWQARHDALTGLNNREALAERLTHAHYEAGKNGDALAVCLLDLDRFQDVNASYGHWAGDRLLKEVALRLKDFAEDPADVARLGGDEFVVLLRGFQNEAGMQNQTLVLLERLSQPYAIDDLQIHVSASAGVALLPSDSTSPDTLLRHADQAMYQAKQQGRGFHVFDARQDQVVQTRYTQLARLTIALHQGEFRLHYQPKVHLGTAEVVGMEALLRWQHPERGLLAPGEFLPLMEHTELIVETGEWVLQQALSQLQAWVGQGHRWGVSVNIAARHFHRPDFVDRLRELLASYPLAPSNLLELEILESAALQDIPHMREVMQGCQALGVRFALDDFGTGFSSLSYLKRLPAETIKIDRMFVEGLLDDPENCTLVEAIVALAQAFDRSVIAEGVETVAQAAKLLELGCALGQGYGIGRPMPAEDVVPWVLSYNALNRTALVDS